MTTSQHRKQVTLDGETEELAEIYIQNLSGWIRDKIREEFRSIENMEAKIDELEAKKRQKRKQIHELESEIDDIDSQIRSLERAVTKNEAIQQIKQRPEWKQAFESSVADIREVKNKDKIPAAKDHNTGKVIEWEPAPDVEVVVQEKVRYLRKKKGVPAETEELKKSLKVAAGVDQTDF